MHGPLPGGRLAALAACWAFLLAAAGPAGASCVCHSKNPSMVRMHERLEAAGGSCFTCHGPLSKRLQGIDGAPEPRDRDPLCQPCHLPGREPSPGSGR